MAAGAVLLAQKSCECFGLIPFFCDDGRTFTRQMKGLSLLAIAVIKDVRNLDRRETYEKESGF